MAVVLLSPFLGNQFHVSRPIGGLAEGAQDRKKDGRNPLLPTLQHRLCRGGIDSVRVSALSLHGELDDEARTKNRLPAHDERQTLLERSSDPDGGRGTASLRHRYRRF